jgi:hypothetical protein
VVAVSAYVPGLPVYAAAEPPAKAEGAIRDVLTAGPVARRRPKAPRWSHRNAPTHTSPSPYRARAERLTRRTAFTRPGAAPQYAADTRPDGSNSRKCDSPYQSSLLSITYVHERGGRTRATAQVDALVRSVQIGNPLIT